MNIDWDDKEEVLAAIPNMYYVKIQNLSDRLKDDFDVMNAAIEHNPNAFQYAGPKVRDNKLLAMKAVKKDGMGFLLREASDRLRDDREVVLCAITTDWQALHYASDRLKDDVTVVSTAAFGNGRSLEYASDRLKGDRRLGLFGMSHGPDGGYGLAFLSEELRDDKEIVITAVSNTADALKYASDRLKNDPEVVTAAVMENYYSLEHASEGLRTNRNFIASLVKKNSSVLRVIDLRFVFDKDFLVDVLKDDPKDILNKDQSYLRYIMGERLDELMYKVGKDTRQFKVATEVVEETMRRK
jgi:hypothetical protein